VKLRNPDISKRNMAHLATVSKKGLMTVPSRLRQKYGIQEGSKVCLIEKESGVLMVPLADISSLYGMGASHKEKILEAVRELEREHDEEAGG
jgi:AbrB family looped-hinge helix DNA binding protein